MQSESYLDGNVDICYVLIYSYQYTKQEETTLRVGERERDRDGARNSRLKRWERGRTEEVWRKKY